jgi:hypothetical protein
MADEKKRLFEFTTSLDSGQATDEVDRFINLVKMNRKGFERRWYDNNFFDDGYHFRYVSRTTGRIVDQNEKGANFTPNRAIPKASRQIRGVANLILQIEPTPVIYPEYIPQSSYPGIPDPRTGQVMPNPRYTQAMEEAKKNAQKQGRWVEYEWDEQELKDKLVLMVLLAAKHGVSFMQVWPDSEEEKIKTKVFDAFDIWIMGEYDDLDDQPMIVKTSTQLISTIKANESFDEEQRLKISADNKFASSEIKQAYMQSRFGSGVPNDTVATLQLREAFIKERVSEENIERIARDLGDNIRDFKKGEQIIRQVFSAGGVWLSDKYTAMKKYPFVDYRFEPGPLYQVPLIERFIPANKSLDIIMSRIERYLNTLPGGVLQKMKGENYTVNNSAGVQVIEYEQKPLQQMAAANLPPIFVNFIQMLEQNIEEQGASTSAINQIPSGVRSGDAIETLKASEYANLKIPTDQLKRTVRHITERMLDIGANYFVKPQQVMQMDNNEPAYFEVIGEVGMQARDKAKVEGQFDGVIIKKNTRVKIEVESGMGFTEAGKKETMQKMVTFLTPFVEKGLFTQDAFKVLLQKFMDIYHFGSTQEFMDALDTGTSTAPLTEDQITQMKIAVMEVLKDTGVVGPQADQKLVDSTKVGTVEALRDTGIADKVLQTQDDDPVESRITINYKDAPEDVKRQMEAEAGFTPSETVSPMAIEQAVKMKQAETAAKKPEVKPNAAKRPA